MTVKQFSKPNPAAQTTKAAQAVVCAQQLKMPAANEAIYIPDGLAVTATPAGTLTANTKASTLTASTKAGTLTIREGE